MKVVSRRREGFVNEIDIEGEHIVLVDKPSAAGGGNAGPSSTRLLAASLASCMAVTMEMYAERKGWDIGKVEVEVDVEYEDHVPNSFAVTLRLPGDLSEEQRGRLLRVAGKCPVHRALTGGARVKIDERVEEL